MRRLWIIWSALVIFVTNKRDGEEKVKKVLIVFVFVLLLTGCISLKTPEKILTCTMSENVEGVDMKMTLTYTFDEEGKKLKYEKVVVEATYTDAGDIETDYDLMMEDCNTIKYYNGITCDVKMANKKLTQTATVDYLNSDEETLDEVSVITDYSYDELKREYRSVAGLNCK